VIQAIGRAFKTPDLRRKLFFTLGLVAVFRLGSFIPAPNVDYTNVQQCLAQTQTTSGLYELVNLFSGGALLQLSIFALGIMPYITASIITQLFRVVIPRFETLYKEGAHGQSKLTQYTPGNHSDCGCSSGCTVWCRLYFANLGKHRPTSHHPDGHHHDRRYRSDHVDW